MVHAPAPVVSKVLGIGCDLCVIARIAAWLDRFGERHGPQLFTALEREQADGRRDRAAAYAIRFAAKEACAKALGTGLVGGLRWTDMELAEHDPGAPELRLSPLRLARLARGEAPEIRVALGRTREIAHATVIILG